MSFPWDGEIFWAIVYRVGEGRRIKEKSEPSNGGFGELWGKQEAREIQGTIEIH